MAQTAPAPDRTLVGVLSSIACAAVAGTVCAVLDAPAVVASSVTAGAAALPSAAAYSWARRRRDPQRDLRRLRQGELRRPVPLVMVLTGAAFFFWDSLVGGVVHRDIYVGALAGAAAEARTIDALAIVNVVVTMIGVFVIAVYASHFMGEHPFLVMTGTVAAVLVARLVVAVVGLWPTAGGSLETVLFGVVVIVVEHVVYLAAALGGAKVGRARQGAFVEARADRLERSLAAASRERAAEPIDGSIDASTEDVKRAKAGPPPPNPAERRLE